MPGGIGRLERGRWSRPAHGETMRFQMSALAVCLLAGCVIDVDGGRGGGSFTTNPPNTSCTSTSQCTEGACCHQGSCTTTQACAGDADCGSGAICLNALCHAACATNADCHAGEYCLGG